MAKKAPMENLKASEATIVVSRTVLKQTTSEAKKIKIRPFVTSTATVSVKFGVTIPLAGYASARADVMIACPCYVEEIAPTYKMVRDLVEALVDKESKKIEKEIVDEG